MKKYMITCCVILCVTLVSGFLIGHFTSSKSNANNNAVCTEHDAQIQGLMQQIHNKQEQIYKLYEL